MVGVALDRPEEQDDRHSVHSIASTVATTTSLASRIRDLNIAFGDKLHEEPYETEGRTLQTPLPEVDSEEERADAPGTAAEDGPSRVLEDYSIAHTLRSLQRDPPMQVCSRLFDRRSYPPLPLKRMTMLQVEDFRQHGYVVIDNFISKEAAARVKTEALRLAQRGQLQPANSSSIGVISNGSAGLVTPLQQSQRATLSSSPCSTSSNHSQGHSHHSSSSNGTGGQQQQQQPPQQHQQHQHQQWWGELRMPLVLGQPPADTAAFAPVMAALQDLQDDLGEFVRLRSKGTAEYCLCQLPAASAAVPRHRDALPDDGRHSSSSGTVSTAAAAAQANGAAGEAPSAGTTGLYTQQQQVHKISGPSAANGPSTPLAAATANGFLTCSGNTAPAPSSGSFAATAAAAAASGALCCQRRVTVIVFVNPDWDREHGGVLRLWPPQRPIGPSSTAAASGAARRSPTSSDAGTTFSELSDCGSLRAAILGSTTSSVVAEASAPDHDTYSLDGLSVAESDAERQGFEWVECEGGEMALDVAPLAGRVLVLLSGAVEHALLPNSGQTPGSHMVFVRAWCS